jgi:hypothetical protein
MTCCGSQFEVANAVFSCVKNVDENGRHLDGDPLHVDEGGPPNMLIKYRAEWTDEAVIQ